MANDEFPIINKDERVLMDVKMGATIFQIQIIEHLKHQLEIWASNPEGTKSIRLDEDDEKTTVPLKPIEVLEMANLKMTKHEVQKTNFDFTLVNELLIRKNSNSNKQNFISIDHEKLRSSGAYDESKQVVTLTDENGNNLEINTMENEGYWLEDIAIQCLANSSNYSEYQVFRNVTIDQDNEKYQLALGLHRLIRGPRYAHPQYIISEIEKMFEAKWEDIQISSPRGNIPSPNECKQYSPKIEGNFSEDARTYVFTAGAINEFDALLQNDDEIITVEIKTSRPDSQHIWKMKTLLPRHINPVKNNGILIHSFFPTLHTYGTDEFFRNKKLLKNLNYLGKKAIEGGIKVASFAHLCDDIEFSWTDEEE